MSDVVLSATGLTAGYVQNEPVIRKIDLALRRGEVVGVLGPNGAGKSTVLRALAGTCPFVTGHAQIDGASVLDRPPSERVGLGLGFVPRDKATFPNLTVEENLRMGGYTLRDRATVAARMEEVLAAIPQLRDLLRRNVLELSGGQAEMAAIGLGLMSQPKALMIDEPSAGLSVGAAASILDALLRIVAERGLPLLLVEQNLGVARRLCSRFYVLESGGSLVGEAEDFNGAIELLERTIHGSLAAS